MVQALAFGPTQEQKHVCTTSERTFIKSKENSCSCSWSIKKITFEDRITLLDFQKARHVIKQP